MAYWADPFPIALWAPLACSTQERFEDELRLINMEDPQGAQGGDVDQMRDEQTANTFFSYVSYGGLMAVRGVPPIEDFYPTEETFPQEYFNEEAKLLEYSSELDTYNFRETFLANTHGCWVGGI
jgi:hypothetical protein